MSDKTLIGRVRSLFVYPVKSMAGISVQHCNISWNGVEGDRNYALLRANDHGGMPWLTASKYPSLLLYQPYYVPDTNNDTVYVRTPDNGEYSVEDAALIEDISSKAEYQLALVKLSTGIFDCERISLISSYTLTNIGNRIGTDLDIRNFRPNIFMDLAHPSWLDERDLVGRSLQIGVEDSGPIVRIKREDERCMMVNLNPDSAQQDPRILRDIVRNQNTNAGVYADIERTGQTNVGDDIYLLP